MTNLLIVHLQVRGANDLATSLLFDELVHVLERPLDYSVHVRIGCDPDLVKLWTQKSMAYICTISHAHPHRNEIEFKDKRVSFKEGIIYSYLIRKFLLEDKSDSIKLPNGFS